VKQDSPFCPNIAATPDGTQVWFTLKDIGRAQVFDARPPFAILKTLDTGPITNPSISHAMPTARLPTSPSWIERDQGIPHRRFRAGRDDSSRQPPARHLAVRRRNAGVCRAENADALAAIDTLTNKVIATIRSPSSAGAHYVSNAVPEGGDTQGLPALGMPGRQRICRSRRHGRQADGQGADQRVIVRSGP